MNLSVRTINFNVPFFNQLSNFLKGKILTVELCNKIYNVSQLMYSDYIKDINDIKQILNLSNIDIYKDIIFIKTKRNVTDRELFLLIRFVNICHKEKYFIVVNNKLVYAPEEIVITYSETDINDYINTKIEKYKKETIKKNYK